MAELKHISSDVMHWLYKVGFAQKLLECVTPAIFLLDSCCAVTISQLRPESLLSLMSRLSQRAQMLNTRELSAL